MVPWAAPSSMLGQGFKDCMPSPWHSPCPRPVCWENPVFLSAVPVKTSWLNFAAVICSGENPTAFSEIWAWKWELWRISQAEGFTKQSCFSLLHENTLMITHHLSVPSHSLKGDTGTQNPARLTDWVDFKLKALYIPVRLQQCILNTSQYLSAPEVVQHFMYSS